MQRRLMVILGIVAAVILVVIIVLLVTQTLIPGLNKTSDPTAAPTQAANVQTDAGGATQDASPEAVVTQYFERWNAKDTNGMEAYLIEADRGLDDYADMPLEASIQVGSITLVPDAKDRFPADAYENPADIALVEASFTVHYNEEGQAMYLRDNVEYNNFMFWLVKETADAPWRIALKGY